MLQEGARIAEVEFKVKSNCLTLKQGQRKVKRKNEGDGVIGVSGNRRLFKEKDFVSTKDKYGGCQ